jgi:hypothetical protein
MDTVPPVGPSPDHAQEYVAPRPLPKPADHLTIEDIPVKVAPQPDPRKMQTQKAMYVLKREEAEKALAEMGIAPAANPHPSQPDQPIPIPPALAPKRSNSWVVILVIVLLLAGIAAFAIQYWLGSVASETPAPATTGALVAPTATRAPKSPRPPPTTTPAAAKTAATATTPAAAAAPTEEPAAAAAVTSKPAPKKDEPRPINE